MNNTLTTLSSQLLKSQNRSSDHVPQRIHEEIGILATIESEFHLCEVSRKMLCADLVPRSDDATLQEREGVFDCVGMNVPVNINLVTMTNGLVLSAFDASSDHRFWIAGVFVRDHYFNIGAHSFFDVLRQRPRLNVASVKEPQFATTLPESDNNFLVAIRSVPSLAASLPTADERFVHFDSTVRHRAICLFHGSTNAMAQVPRGLIAHSESTFDLIGTHSFSGLAQKQHGHEPCFEREMGVVEYSLGKNAELVSALDTFKFLLRADLENTLAFASDAFHAEGPTEFLKQSAALFISGEHLRQIGECHG